jgi:Bacterial Ig-like domain (group 3)
MTAAGGPARSFSAVALIATVLLSLGGPAVAGASPPAPMPVPGTLTLSGVACVNGSACVVVGQSTTHLDVVVPVTNGTPGSAVVGSEHVRLRRIACVSAASCVAVGGGGGPPGKGVVVPITNGVPGAAQPVSGTGVLTDVACDSSGACEASGLNEQFTEGVVVSISEGAPVASHGVPSTTGLFGIVCPAVASCLAVGSQQLGPGAVVPIANGIPQTPEPVNAPAELQLLDIDCSSATSCTAAGLAFYPFASGLAAVPVTNGVPGAAQITPNVPTAGEIGSAPIATACPSSQLCLAAGAGLVRISGVVAPIVNGYPDAPQEVPGFASPFESGLSDIACPAGGACVAVGQTSSLEGAVVSFAPASGAPAATAVSVTPTSGAFGQPVSATVTVSSPVGTPSGRVYFAIDGVFADYPQRLDESGQTVFTLRGLAPGTHTLTAAYVGPGGVFSGGGTAYESDSATTNVDVTCATTISGEWPRNLVVSNPGVCLSGARVSGTVSVRNGASLSIASSTITGSLAASGPSALRVCGSTVEQSAKVSGATGYVLIGDRGVGENFDGCPANTIKGTLTLSNDAGGATAVGNSVGSIKAATVSGAGGYPFELAPRLAPNTLLASGESTFLATRQSGAHGQPVDGIECEGSEQLVSHYHAHLAIFAGGQQRAVPDGVGMVGPLAEVPTPYGPFDHPETGCIYWVHTHDQTGMIHLELPAEFAVTVGDFFDLWGQPLSSTQVGPVTGKVVAFVNGVRYSGDPRNVLLGDHTLVQLDIGTPVVPPQPYEFTATNP